MSLTLMEGAVNTIYSYLNTNIAAKLDVLDTEYSDFVLPDIKKWYKAEVSEVPGFPAIFVLSDSSELVGEGDGWLQMAHYITIGIIATNPNTLKLRQMLWRYTRAVIELIIAARSSVGWAYIIQIKNVEYSDLYGRGDDYLGDTRINIVMSKSEAT